MDKEMKKMSIVDFVDLTASNSPVPGGGSISALCGVLSMALTEMVAGLTIGRKKYEQQEGVMIDLKEKAADLRDSLMADIQRDSDAYARVMDAFKLSKDTEGEKAKRSEVIQSSMINAADVPLEVAKKAFSALELCEIVVEKGNSNAVTDGMVAAMLARTAVLGALLNVKINLSSIKDEDYVSGMKEQVDFLEQECMDKERKVMNSATLI